MTSPDDLADLLTRASDIIRLLLDGHGTDTPVPALLLEDAEHCADYLVLVAEYVRTDDGAAPPSVN